MIYELLVNLDGQELPSTTIDGPEAAAKDRALELLAERVTGISIGFCAVFEGQGDGAEPLGAWVVDEPKARPRWEPED